LDNKKLRLSSCLLAARWSAGGAVKP
jgi:hypothetical protein